MSGSEKIRILLCVAATVVMGVFIRGLAGRKSSGTDTKASARAQEVASQPHYANDVDRLRSLSQRLSKASGRWFMTVLGGTSLPAGGGLVSVDYALFDRLSDNGAAVLIAEAVLADIAASSLPIQFAKEQARESRRILHTDQDVGRLIARAGFEAGGFTEYLKARSAKSPEEQTVADNARLIAFMRGYASAKSQHKQQVTQTNTFGDSWRP